ncbi:MAG TPA: metal-dependent transcriptional regulator [bacterium]|nr:metal-dependent transcriptional regulator [bacterium]HOL46694.1 metal-dependent transcriptional regulator [bacterium]HPQ18382.1 metal-dependent transcriptional regulator [bacterium]
MDNEKILEQIQENLEYIWINEVEKKNKELNKNNLPFNNDEIIKYMLDNDIIKIENEKIRLTENGSELAKKYIRRHRLSELVYSQLFDIKTDIHNQACKLEHLLIEGVEDKVCSLLGHPKKCPHGTPIPEGECCKKAKEESSKKIFTLNDLPIGMKAKIIYIAMQEPEEVNKIISMGIQPGSEVIVERRFPSYIFQIGNSKFGVDEKIAETIVVRID